MFFLHISVMAFPSSVPCSCVKYINLPNLYLYPIKP